MSAEDSTIEFLGDGEWKFGARGAGKINHTPATFKHFLFPGCHEVHPFVPIVASSMIVFLVTGLETMEVANQGLLSLELSFHLNSFFQVIFRMMNIHSTKFQKLFANNNRFAELLQK